MSPSFFLYRCRRHTRENLGFDTKHQRQRCMVSLDQKSSITRHQKKTESLIYPKKNTQVRQQTRRPLTPQTPQNQRQHNQHRLRRRARRLRHTPTSLHSVQRRGSSHDARTSHCARPRRLPLQFLVSRTSQHTTLARLARRRPGETASSRSPFSFGTLWRGCGAGSGRLVFGE